MPAAVRAGHFEQNDRLCRRLLKIMVGRFQPFERAIFACRERQLVYMSRRTKTVHKPATARTFGTISCWFCLEFPQVPAEAQELGIRMLRP